MHDIRLSENEYETILEALRLTKYVKFLNDEAKAEFKELGIKLGDAKD